MGILLLVPAEAPKVPLTLTRPTASTALLQSQPGTGRRQGWSPWVNRLRSYAKSTRRVMQAGSPARHLPQPKQPWNTGRRLPVEDERARDERRKVNRSARKGGDPCPSVPVLACGKTLGDRGPSVIREDGDEVVLALSPKLSIADLYGLRVETGHDQLGSGRGHVSVSRTSMTDAFTGHDQLGSGRGYVDDPVLPLWVQELCLPVLSLGREVDKRCHSPVDPRVRGGATRAHQAHSTSSRRRPWGSGRSRCRRGGRRRGGACVARKCVSGARASSFSSRGDAANRQLVLELDASAKLKRPQMVP